MPRSALARHWPILLTAVAVAACSSGGGGGTASVAAGSAPPNRPPVVDAGSPQYALAGGLVVLSGAASDPDGGELKFRWRQVGGPAVALAGASSAMATFEAPAYTDPAALDFELEVTDSTGMPSTDDTNVTVIPGYLPCTVTSPPADLGVDSSFYQKYCDANGQAVLSPAAVPDGAVAWARYQMLEMLKRMPLVAQAMVRNGGRLTVKGETQVLTDIPEYSDLYSLYPDFDWDALPGVGAGPTRPVTSTSEENLLCSATDPYKGFSVLIHEFAHSIHLIGLAFVDPAFEPRLKLTYETAMASGLWAGTYSSVNAQEYWAEGVGIWFDAHWSSINRPEVIDTREELAAYDDGLYRLIREFFAEDDIALCPPAAAAG